MGNLTCDFEQNFLKFINHYDVSHTMYGFLSFLGTLRDSTVVNLVNNIDIFINIVCHGRVLVPPL